MKTIKERREEKLESIHYAAFWDSTNTENYPIDNINQVFHEESSVFNTPAGRKFMSIISFGESYGMWIVCAIAAVEAPGILLLYPAANYFLEKAPSWWLEKKKRLETFMYTLDRSGWTPLHYAAAGGSIESAKYLIEKGADYELKDSEGRTFLAIAKLCGEEQFYEKFDDFLKARENLLRLKNEIKEQSKNISKVEQAAKEANERLANFKAVGRTSDGTTLFAFSAPEPNPSKSNPVQRGSHFFAKTREEKEAFEAAENATHNNK